MQLKNSEVGLSVRDTACSAILGPRSLVFLAIAALAIAVLLVTYPLSVSEAALAVATIGGIVAMPVVGIPVISFLGLLGDLQHFESGLSLVQPIFLVTGLGLLLGLATKKIVPRRTGLAGPLIVFTLVYTVGVARSAVDAEKQIGLLTVLGYPVAFLLVLNLVRTRRHLYWVLAALVLGTTLAAAASIYQEYSGLNALVALRGTDRIETDEVGMGLNRALGFVKDPNAAAYPFLIAMPLTISAAFVVRRKAIRISLAGVICANSFGLILTFSRSAYIAIALGLLFLLFTMERRECLWTVFMIGVFLSALLFVIPGQSLITRFAEVSDQLGTLTDRSVMYQMAVDQLLRSPIFGGGSEVFKSEFATRFGVPLIAHSNLLEVAINSGLLGLASLLWFVWLYVSFVRRGIASMDDSPLRSLALGACAGLVAFLIQGFFIVNMGWVLFWVMAAIPPCCILAHRDGVRPRAAFAGSVSHCRMGLAEG